MLKATRVIARASLDGRFGGSRQPAKAAGKRRVLSGGKPAELPLYRVDQQSGGVQASGPCVLEEDFFTSRIDAGWKFEINESGDILLSRA